jgi:hypothetical protein
VDADRRAPEPQTRLKESLNVGEQIEKLAQFIARTGWDDMPGAVHRRAKLVLLDTIGVTLAGAARPEVIGLRERLCWARVEVPRSSRPDCRRPTSARRRCW